jgi:hypothetical protein
VWVRIPPVALELTIKLFVAHTVLRREAKLFSAALYIAHENRIAAGWNWVGEEAIRKPPVEHRVRSFAARAIFEHPVS